MYNKGKERVSRVLGGKFMQNVKEGILDTAEEGLIKAYNFGQKVKEKVFTGKKYDESENTSQAFGGNASSASNEEVQVSNEEKTRINEFESNLNRVNKFQKEQNRVNTNKAYGNMMNKKPKQEWLEKYTDSEGRTRALSRKRFFDQQKGVMLKGENIRTRALRDIRNRLGLRRR